MNTLRFGRRMFGRGRIRAEGMRAEGILNNRHVDTDGRPYNVMVGQIKRGLGQRGF